MLLLTLNGTRRRSWVLVSTTGCELITPSKVQYCSSTQSKAAAHSNWSGNWKIAELVSAEEENFNGGKSDLLTLALPEMSIEQK